MRSEHFNELPEVVQDKIYTEALRRGIAEINEMKDQFKDKKKKRDQILLICNKHVSPETQTFIEQNIENPEFWNATIGLITTVMMPFVAGLKMTSITIDLPKEKFKKRNT